MLRTVLSHVSTENLFILPQNILNGLWPKDVGGILGCVHIWLLLSVIHLYLVFVDCMASCVHRQWFLEVFLSPFSEAQERIMSAFNAVALEGPKVTLGRPVQPWTLHLQSHAVVFDAVFGLVLSCWNLQGTPWQRCCLDGSMLLFMYFMCIKFPFMMIWHYIYITPLCTLQHGWCLSRYGSCPHHRH